MVYPRRVETNLIVRELDGETLVYNKRNHETHCLNQTSAALWQLCDGRMSPAELTERLRQDAGSAVDADVVWLALQQLEKAHLLEQPVPRADAPTRVSRRELAKRLRLAGSIALLPVVLSIVAPTAAHAGSGLPSGSACSEAAQCANDACNDGVCA